MAISKGKNSISIEEVSSLISDIDIVAYYLNITTIPIVSINYEIEGAYYVGIDNKKPIADMMEHLYTEHDCRRFI